MNSSESTDTLDYADPEGGEIEIQSPEEPSYFENSPVETSDNPDEQLDDNDDLGSEYSHEGNGELEPVTHLRPRPRRRTKDALSSESGFPSSLAHFVSDYGSSSEEIREVEPSWSNDIEQYAPNQNDATTGAVNDEEWMSLDHSTQPDLHCRGESVSVVEQALHTDKPTKNDCAALENSRDEHELSVFPQELRDAKQQLIQVIEHLEKQAASTTAKESEKETLYSHLQSLREDLHVETEQRRLAENKKDFLEKELLVLRNSNRQWERAFEDLTRNYTLVVEEVTQERHRIHQLTNLIEEKNRTMAILEDMKGSPSERANAFTNHRLRQDFEKKLREMDQELNHQRSLTQAASADAQQVNEENDKMKLHVTNLTGALEKIRIMSRGDEERKDELEKEVIRLKQLQSESQCRNSEEIRLLREQNHSMKGMLAEQIGQIKKLSHERAELMQLMQKASFMVESRRPYARSERLEHGDSYRH